MTEYRCWRCGEPIQHNPAYYQHECASEIGWMEKTSRKVLTLGHASDIVFNSASSVAGLPERN